MVDACLATYLMLLARSCRRHLVPRSSCRSGSGRSRSGPNGGGRQAGSRQQGPNTGHYRRAAAHGPANRKLASVRADLEETETVTQAREQHAPRKATCDFEAALR